MFEWVVALVSWALAFLIGWLASNTAYNRRKAASKKKCIACGRRHRSSSPRLKSVPPPAA